MTEPEFFQLALSSYKNVQCHSIEEFEDDLSRISLIRKRITIYQNEGEICSRLILNYLIILYNVFGDSATKLILHKTNQEQYPVLFPFLIFLNRLTDADIEKFKIVLDENILESLGKI